MEAIVERIGTSVGSVAEFVTTGGLAFVIVAVLWVAFGVGLVGSQGTVTAAGTGSAPTALDGSPDRLDARPVTRPLLEP